MDKENCSERCFVNAAETIQIILLFNTNMIRKPYDLLAGWLWSSSKIGVQVFDEKGKTLGLIPHPLQNILLPLVKN